MQTIHYYATPDEGITRLHVCRVLPEGEPRFAVQIIHGASERVERYIPLMEHIARRGGAAIMHDLRGHGGSVPNPKQLGCYGDLYHMFREDIDMVYATVDESVSEFGLIAPAPMEEYEVPVRPRYLLGFSMGALIAGLYAAHASAGLAGLILAGLPHREPFVSFALAGIDAMAFFRGEQVPIEAAEQIRVHAVQQGILNGARIGWAVPMAFQRHCKSSCVCRRSNLQSQELCWSVCDFAPVRTRHVSSVVMEYGQAGPAGLCDCR